jgi:hypothetical protein
LWDVSQGFQELLIVAFIRRVRPAVARRVNAGGAFQRIDRQAAIVGQHPLSQVPGLLGGLQFGVGGECVSIFDNVNGVGNVGQRAKFPPRWSEQRGELLAFLAIPRADYK